MGTRKTRTPADVQDLKDALAGKNRRSGRRAAAEQGAQAADLTAAYDPNLSALGLNDSKNALDVPGATPTPETPVPKIGPLATEQLQSEMTEALAGEGLEANLSKSIIRNVVENPREATKLANLLTDSAKVDHPVVAGLRAIAAGEKTIPPGQAIAILGALRREARKDPLRLASALAAKVNFSSTSAEIFIGNYLQQRGVPSHTNVEGSSEIRDDVLNQIKGGLAKVRAGEGGQYNLKQVNAVARGVEDTLRSEAGVADTEAGLIQKATSGLGAPRVAALSNDVRDAYESPNELLARLQQAGRGQAPGLPSASQSVYGPQDVGGVNVSPEAADQLRNVFSPTRNPIAPEIAGESRFVSPGAGGAIVPYDRVRDPIKNAMGEAGVADAWGRIPRAMFPPAAEGAGEALPGLLRRAAGYGLSHIGAEAAIGAAIPAAEWAWKKYISDDDTQQERLFQHQKQMMFLDSPENQAKRIYLQQRMASDMATTQALNAKPGITAPLPPPNTGLAPGSSML